jgi:hypothetical protein
MPLLIATKKCYYDVTLLGSYLYYEKINFDRLYFKKNNIPYKKGVQPQGDHDYKPNLRNIKYNFFCTYVNFTSAFCLRFLSDRI